MNLYFDTTSHLGSLYGFCKDECLSNNKQLKKDVEEHADKDSKKSKYFDPMTGDPCLSQCRSQFYFMYKRMNNYFSEDKGFYIESAHKISLN